MSLESYVIAATAAGGWTIVHNGSNEGHYLSKEAAFGAAVAAASLAIREGHEVRLNIPSRHTRESPPRHRDSLTKSDGIYPS
jgi:hypothetical protein